MAVEALKEHRKRQSAERLQASNKWQDHDLLFCREDGTAVRGPALLGLDRWLSKKADSSSMAALAS